MVETSLENILGRCSILETSLEKSLEKIRKIGKKVLTSSYKRKMRNINEIFTKVRIVDT